MGQDAASELLKKSPHKEAILKSRILIVEDEAVSREILKQIFAKNGFANIIEATNGKDGLAKAREHKPDLVITDLRMPEMDGYALCRALRAEPDPALSAIPILVRTALDDPSDRAEVWEARATDYFSKPVNADDLLARCVTHLGYLAAVRRARELIRQEIK